jgi:hypothetical protein
MNPHPVRMNDKIIFLGHLQDYRNLTFSPFIAFAFPNP